MTLPLSRDKTYAATDHVNLSHLTHWQDILRMLWAGQHGQKIIAVPAFHAQFDSLWDMDKSAVSFMRHGSGGTARMAVPIVLPAGTIPTFCSVGWNPAAIAAGLTLTLKGIAFDGTVTAYGTVVSNNLAHHQRSFTPTLAVFASDEAYFLEVISTDLNAVVAGVAVTYRQTGRVTAP